MSTTSVTTTTGTSGTTEEKTTQPTTITTTNGKATMHEQEIMKQMQKSAKCEKYKLNKI